MKRNNVIASDIETGTALSAPFESNVLNDKEFRDECISLIKPSLLKDVREMVRGRTLWRRASVVSETLGKVTSAAATVLAFAAASDLAGGDASRVIGFVSGSVGTTSMVLILFANFARAQSIERADAINLILDRVDIDPIPDISRELLVNDANTPLAEYD